jgi:Putative restriction endonuclease
MRGRVVLEVPQRGVQLVLLDTGEGVGAGGGADAVDVAVVQVLEVGGVGVSISKFQHRVPDVAMVRAGSFETLFQETPPELVVEVASPRTRLYDRNRRKDVYQGFGIPRTGWSSQAGIIPS